MACLSSLALRGCDIHMYPHEHPEGYILKMKIRRLGLIFITLMLAGGLFGSLGWANLPALPSAISQAQTAVPPGPPASLMTPAPAPGPPPGYLLRLHPDGDLYVGDLVSLELIAPEGEDMEGREAEVQVDPPDGPTLGPEAFSPFGIGQRTQATLQWAWDTSAQEPGEHRLLIRILPDGPGWVESVYLWPPPNPASVPPATWQDLEIECCHLYYIRGTPAERDLDELARIAEAQARAIGQALGAGLEDPVPVVLLPRVLGHGGFAGNQIYISYLDRNYAGNDFKIVMRHELVHILDARQEAGLRPPILSEGLAVYLTGGHFKREPLIPRAAALLDLGWYLPLEPLSENFYFSQHEIGYLQAGALVAFMANTWGFEAFMDFYHDIQPHESGSQARAIDQALQTHFGLTFAGLEERYRNFLRHYPLIADLRADVALSVYFFDTVRRYQQVLDLSAYFLSAWLPDFSEMYRRGLVADYVRTPMQPENLTLEALLVSADSHLRAGRYLEAERLLQAINAVLEAYEHGEPNPFETNPTAAEARAIVAALSRDGYLPRTIEVRGDVAAVSALAPDQLPVQITLVKLGDAWELSRQPVLPR